MSKSKVPNPCIDVCKYKRQGHCIGCSMTKSQKGVFKRLKSAKHQAAFVKLLVAQQEVLGKFKGWQRAYAHKCAKKGAPNPAG